MAASMKKHGKHKKTKVIIEFDEKARSDYLKGFQKRKTERLQVARDKRDIVIKEERRAILQQIRDLKKNNGCGKSEIIIPEIEQLVEPEVFDLPEHTVTIANIGQVDFVGKSGMRLGQNTGQESSDEEDAPEKKESQKPDKQFVADNKALMRKLANCSNQLSSQKLKSQKANRKQHVRAKLQAKRVKRKKNKSSKPKKR